LSNSLTKLNCSYNQIKSLDNLPNSLVELDCKTNQIISLDNLPKNLEILNDNLIKTI
jgi:Leucine-rich repeat (LRR) protein